ncbi:MAG: g-D-glutamyl-meso-diaminopimelate peptidase [Parcubacteria group bacterium Gr01-1014_46]|nr:MAG: g-D-glutamyl-meso-diaminopimelate peptidase [Parcubacteria group bacterium Gr01-1014_46]
MRQKTFSIFGLVLAGLFVVQTAGATVALVDTPPNPTPSLRLGSRGDAVKVLQSQLSKVPNIYPEGLITGYFGTLTERAIKKLQGENGLEVVGIVGPKTRELLNKISKNSLFAMATNYIVTPQLFVIESSSNSPTRGYVFWTANKNVKSEFWYSNTTPVASTSPANFFVNNLSFTHSVNLPGLSTSTTYYYMIKITDERGNSATSTERNFTTLSQ